PAAAKRVLETVAMAGRPVEWGVVTDAGSLPSVVAQEALVLLRTQRFVRTTGTRRGDVVETFHDRVRESVSRALDDEAAKDGHARLAAALERAGNADPEALA